jgi:hypothetical protein
VTDRETVSISRPTRWEDEEVRCESRLLDPADDEHVYLELHLHCV